MTRPILRVFVTHGRKYHIDAECPRMNCGEDLWDFDDEWGNHHSSGAHRHTVYTLQQAADLGKYPCLHCVPVTIRVLPESPDFGHRPYDEYEHEDNPGLSHIVCERCMVWTRWHDVGMSAGVRVPWPCSTARMLDLA